MHPNAGWSASLYRAAAVVDVVLRSVLRRLRLPFAGDRVAAVTADDEFPGVGQLVALIDLVAEQGLHAIERAAIDERLVRAGIPLALMEALRRCRSDRAGSSAACCAGIVGTSAV